jgi:hypothetical protein
VQQYIEGFNVADLGWGTASAQTITVSFWVRSSLTGTFAGSVSNSAANRSYVFTYNISSANTWEYKTITIAGDTSGTWLTNNGRGILLTFDLGNGSNYQATAGSWVSQYAVGTSSSVKVISTVGATWQITGVQLEKGSTATSFDYRPYGTELALCQRYYEVSGQNPIYSGNVSNGATYYKDGKFGVTKRASPTMSYTAVGNLGFAAGAPIANSVSPSEFSAYKTANATTNGAYYQFSWIASAEL